MRNTGIRYNSKERMPTVLSEMAELLPPLSGEQLAVLEADLLANGCYAPVIVNEDMVIVDGHNRQKLHPFESSERSSLQMPNTTVSSLICWQSGHTSRPGPSLPAMTGKLEDSAVC